MFGASSESIILDGAQITLGQGSSSRKIVSLKKSSAETTYAAVLPLASFSSLQTVSSSTDCTVYSRRSWRGKEAQKFGGGGEDGTRTVTTVKRGGWVGGCTDWS